MGGLSIWHLILLAAIALILFGGRGKISDLMGDFGKGVKSFRKGLSEEDRSASLPQIAQEHRDAAPVANGDKVVRS